MFDSDFEKTVRGLGGPDADATSAAIQAGPKAPSYERPCMSYV